MRAHLALPLLLLSWTFVGCAPSSERPRFVDETYRGRLEAGDQILEQDGSFYDRYAFYARRGDRIVITMQSDEVDSVLALFDSSSQQIAANDDEIEMGGDRDSRIEILAPKDDVYTVLANAVHAGESGAYVVHVRTSAGPPATEGASPSSP